MKNLLLSTFILFAFNISSYAQMEFDADNIFGGGNIAYAKPMGDFSDFAKGGISYNVILGYQLTDKLGVGGEYGVAVTAAIGEDIGISLYGLTSYLAKGWYRFSTGNFRPYVGVGIGLAQVEEPDVTINDQTIYGSTRIGFGANIEVGLNIKGFNLSYGFNLGGKVPKEPVFHQRAADLSVQYHRFAVGYIYNF